MHAVFIKSNYSVKIRTEMKLMLSNKISYNQEKENKEAKKNFDRTIQLFTNGFKANTRLLTSKHFPSSLFNDTKDIFGSILLYILVWFSCSYYRN